MHSGEFKQSSSALDDAAASLLATVLAHAVNLESMARGFIVMLAADLQFQSIHLRREELDGSSAISTDHMVMAATVVLMLVAGDSVVKGNFARQPTFRQELKRAINRGESDARIAFSH